MYKGAFFGGKTAGGTAYLREKSAAVRAGFGIAADFSAAIVAEKTRLFLKPGFLVHSSSSLSRWFGFGLCPGFSPGFSRFLVSG